MLHKYDFETGSLDDEPIIKAIRGKEAEDYMKKLDWFDNNPKPMISISERNQ